MSDGQTGAGAGGKEGKKALPPVPAIPQSCQNKILRDAEGNWWLVDRAENDSDVKAYLSSVEKLLRYSPRCTLVTDAEFIQKLRQHSGAAAAQSAEAATRNNNASAVLPKSDKTAGGPAVNAHLGRTAAPAGGGVAKTSPADSGKSTVAAGTHQAPAQDRRLAQDRRGEQDRRHAGQGHVAHQAQPAGRGQRPHTMPSRRHGDRISVPESLIGVIYQEANGEILVATGRENDPEVVSFFSVLKRTNQHIDFKRRSVPAAEIAARTKKEEGALSEVEDTDMVRLAMHHLEAAVDKGASDIHIRQYTNRASEIWMRWDGHMRIYEEDPRSAEVLRLQRTFFQTMTTQTSGDATFLPLMPQDASITRPEMLPPGVTGVRVATHPHKYGTLMVLRLLYSRVSNAEGTMEERLSKLGFDNDHILAIEDMTARPTGITVIAGVTGAGKSTTMMHLNEALYDKYQGRNFLTIEDPPEYDIRGAVQFPVIHNEKDAKHQGNFARTIRAALRLDPDNVMVGEVRDPASAGASVNVAITGHPVLTTVHTNSAFHILVRMYALTSASDDHRGVDPKIYFTDPFTIAGLVYQSLVPCLCQRCKVELKKSKSSVAPEDYKRWELAGLLDHPVYVTGEGCEDCGFIGVKGRTVLSETVATDEDLLALYSEKGLKEAKAYWMKNLHGRPVQAHAMQKAAQGLIDPRAAEEKVGRFRAMDTNLWAPGRKA